MKVKMDLHKQAQFIKTAPKTTVSVNQIQLKYSIHKKGIPTNLITMAKNLASKGVTELTNTLVVGIQYGEDTPYFLISGYKGYCLANLMGIEKISVIIVEESRNSYIKKYVPIIPNTVNETVNIEDVKISKTFLQHRPSKVKVDRAIRDYRNIGRFNGQIVLNQENVLCNGYSRFVAAVQMGLETIEVHYPKEVVKNE